MTASMFIPGNSLYQMSILTSSHRTRVRISFPILYSWRYPRYSPRPDRRYRRQHNREPDIFPSSRHISHLRSTINLTMDLLEYL